MPIGLRHVISGILAGGIPGFRMVLLLLHSPCGMAWWFFGFFLLFLLPYHVEMIQCYHLLHELAYELAPVTPCFCGFVWKSAVHRSTVRSNASSKFLQNYAGRRVRQPRTPNTSAERKFTNLIKLKQYRVKKTVSLSTPTCWRQAPSFRSRRNMISHRETKHNKQKNEERQGRWVPSVDLSYVKLCDTAALVH